MRLFVATRLSCGARQALRPPLDLLIEGARGALRAVPRQSEHFTHVFLGDREGGVAAILDALEPIAATAPFQTELGAAHVFPRRGRPRLVCLGVIEGEAPLSELAEAVREGLLPLFPDLDAYRLKPPHVTLARFRKRARRRDGRETEEHLAGRMEEWRVCDRLDRIELIRSDLSSAGASYETVGEVRFGGSDRKPGSV